MTELLIDYLVNGDGLTKLAGVVLAVGFVVMACVIGVYILARSFRT